MNEYYEEEYQGISFNKTTVLAIYESCVFLNCDMQSLKFGDSKFIDCRFEGCDLSNSDIHNTAFRNVTLYSCKLIGLRFDTINDFGFAIDIDNCILDYCVFTNVNLQKSKIVNTSLKEVDFSLSNLKKVLITNCNLQGATFNNTDLKGTDLSGSIHINIDPTNNQIYKMKIDQGQLLGLLNRYELLIN